MILHHQKLKLGCENVVDVVIEQPRSALIPKQRHESGMASHSALFHRKPERTSGSRNGVVEQIRASDLVRSPATEDSSPRTQILPKSSLFTTRMVNLHDTILSLLTDPWHTRWIAPCLVLLEIILCAGIVNYVSCRSEIGQKSDGR